MTCSLPKKQNAAASRARSAQGVTSPFNLKFFLGVLGFGLYLGWSIIGSSASLMHPHNASAIASTAIHGSLERFIWIILPLLAGWLTFAFKSPRLHTALALLAGVCTTLGTAVAHVAFSLQVPQLLPYGELPVAASSLFIVLWGEYLCSLDENDAIVCASSATLISFASVLACGTLGPISQAVLHVAMPAGSCILFFVSTATAFNKARVHETPRHDTKDASQAIEAPASKAPTGSFPFRAFIGIALFGTTVVLLQRYSEQKASVPDEFLWIVAGLTVNLVVLVTALIHRRIRTSSLSRPILPLFVASAFLIFATDFGQQALEVFTIGCSWAYFRLFSWIIWRAAAQKTSLPALCVIALGQVALSIGTALGGVLHGVLETTGPSPIAPMAAICLLSVLVATFFLDTRYIAELADAPTLFNPTDPAHCERCVDVATARFGLSATERQVARLLVQGDDNQAIQQRLVIATATLRTHLRNLYRKTDTHSREELVILLRSLV